jgi:hypothetical protein
LVSFFFDAFFYASGEGWQVCQSCRELGGGRVSEQGSYRGACRSCVGVLFFAVVCVCVCVCGGDGGGMNEQEELYALALLSVFVLLY